MARIDRTKLLQQCIEEAEQANADVVSTFGNLPLTQLQLQPAEGKWSAAECLQHCNICNRLYNSRLERLFEEATLLEVEDPMLHKPGYFGAMMIKQLRPGETGGISAPMKTFKSMIPDTAALLNHSVVEDFVAENEKLIHYMNRSQKLHVSKLKVVSAAGPILRFKLGDVFPFLNAHNARHILQAKRAAKLA